MKNGYVRFTYWIDLDQLRSLEEVIAAECEVRQARQYVCEVLRPGLEAGYVRPDVWNRACNRQGSWFRASSMANKVLVVSSSRLDDQGFRLETVIRESDYLPPCLPGVEEQLDLVRSSGYIAAKPAEWDDVSEKEKDRITRQARLVGVRDSIEDILLSRSANHANFLMPRYYEKTISEIVPFSIGKSGKVCSACLEFFNVIGRQFRTKMVVPCAGAVLFGGMRPNRYYEVNSFTTDRHET